MQLNGEPSMRMPAPLLTMFVLVMTDDQTGFVIFTTKLNLRTLRSADTALMDGTLKSCPRQFLSAVYDFSLRQYVLHIQCEAILVYSVRRSAYLCRFRKSGYECSRNEIRTISVN